MEKKLILITNDDSVNAPGIHFLVDCVKDMGEVWVVAPAEPKSCLLYTSDAADE